MNETITVRELIRHLLEHDLDLPIYYSDSTGEEHGISITDFFEYSVGQEHERFIIEF